jgi:hypothetical protein
MRQLDRREVLSLFASVPIATALGWTEAEIATAQEARATRPESAPRFFAEEEYETLRVLVDVILPEDERSPSATAAGVPEFIDFMMGDPEQPDDELTERQIAMRGGLAWLDYECEKRFYRAFLACSEDERMALLDDIAWPERASAAMAQGAAFFCRLRDLTATGFFTSEIGFRDLDYRGNEFVTEWTGCPDEALERLGVTRPARNEREGGS